MLYNSTRDKEIKLSGHQAILQGLSEEGGLFVPEQMPQTFPYMDYLQKSYAEIAQGVLHLFLDDYTEEELMTCIQNAYGTSFDTEEIVPLKKYSDGYFMELWHGPTSAFKDLALTLLPHLMTTAYKKESMDKTIAILTATSGDTGKAALNGFADVPNTVITVFYPNNGVSKVQKAQMVTSRGNNVRVVAVNGNFDDCQRMVKEAYASKDVQSHLGRTVLSSANSINTGRLIPQVVYYFSSYIELIRRGAIQPGEKVSFVVPTGNFGDILAGYLAKKAGLPVKKLICASNDNHILTDFLETGIYNTRRPFKQTISPSMDILISSNLERLLYFASDGNSELVSNFMRQLKETGTYTVPKELLESIQSEFEGYWVSEEDCKSEIKQVYEKDHLLIDPHTAVGAKALERYKEKGNRETCIALSTASPFKFSSTVLSCISNEVPNDEFATMLKLSEITGNKIPQGLKELPALPVRFHQVIEVKEGIPTVSKILEDIQHD